MYGLSTGTEISDLE